MSKDVNFSRGYLVYLLIFLGMMSAFGPFVTDMYLPSLPAMAQEFSSSVSEVQGGITASLIGLAIGQVLFGPLSDRYGRKLIMYVSLLLFSLATVGDIYSETIGSFNFFRVFQGIGGSGGIVLSRSVATDCYSGRELAKTMAVIGAINGVAPVAAPVVGGMVANHYGWQGVFWVLFFLGVFLLFLTVPFSESLVAEKRFRGTFGALYMNFWTLLRNRQFMLCVLVFGLSNGALFSYISSAPFICQTIFGYSDTAFSIIFAVNAIAIVGGSGLAMRFKKIESATVAGGILLSTCAILLLINAVAWHSFWGYEIVVWTSLVGLGLIFPSITSIAMNHGRIAIGAASAIVGAAGFIAGGIVSPLCGTGNILLPSAIVMTISGIFLLIFSKKVS